MPDIKMLRRVLDVVEQAEAVGLWEQQVWWTERDNGESIDVEGQHFCGTAYCFAGWTLALAGFQPATPCYMADTDGGHVLVSVKARELLGLDEDQAADLFHEDNDLDDLREMVETFAVEEEAKADV